MKLRSSVCFVGFIWVTTLIHAEWPEFRGPSGQGHASLANPPLVWSQDLGIGWKTPLPGNGWSSPVVSQGKIFLTAAVALPEAEEGEYSLRAMALEMVGGKVLWDKEIFRQEKNYSPSIHSKNSHASPTPLVEGDRVYFHFGHQGTACLSSEGEILWRNDSLRYEPVHGNGSSPISIGDQIFFSCDGGKSPFVVALDKATGKVVWKKDRNADAKRNFSFCTALMIEVEGRLQVISPGSDAVIAYDPRDGEEIWRVRYDGYSVVPRPVYAHGLIFISTGFDRPKLMAIRPTGKGDITETHVAWTQNRSVPNTPSMVVVGNDLYMVSDGGIATCMDALTGETHWRERLGGNYSASPTFVNGRLYFVSEEGITTVLKPGKEFVVLAKNDLEERTLASPAFVGDSILMRTAQHLYCIRPPSQG